MAEDMRVKELKTVFSPEQIAMRVRELAAEIDSLYGQEPLVAVCVLKGAFIFFSDLARSLHNQNMELDFIRLSSYGMSSSSSRHVILNKDVEVDIRGKHVLIVEDVVDSGYSMRFLLDRFAARQARSLRLAALVDKHERRQADVTVDFAGFRLNKGFIVGYGLDYAERYRTLPGICEIIPE
ncbi:hypoxanthine phosphoribosyltransferase [uncultured Desulfovibrio sp.]|jgi:hypoxanthine phosphoribosyltransferase|uniref:hypoxanthine phosphoribosyltransferase n=1 Tax=uncultured Desulfovibrio sp. TaxID=167968 RepID=UPI0026318DFE|nr:hypoxanthine phosphoribosyltransferase [uncultured Desulfovibrio sp.]